MYISKLICQFLLICFWVNVPEISAKPDKFLLNYNKYFAVHFLCGHS